tara:strand:+ start:249 stop:632 length:384 start_codon:yes stop_codon:yes gene_type:complete
MKLACNFALLALILMTPACETLGKAAQGVNINALLAGITDAATAQDAKPALDAAMGQMSVALEGAKKEAASAAEGNAAEGEGMVNAVLAQFGVTGETAGTVNTLLENPAVAGVLGGTLQQLMGMITG